MNENQVEKPWKRPFALNGLSLQQRLPLLICILLCSVILTFSLASYYAVKNVSLELGKKRLRTMTDQFGTWFGQSAQTFNTTMLNAARHDSVKKCLRSGGVDLVPETMAILRSLKKDSTWIL